MQKAFLKYDNPIASYPSTLVIISVAYVTTITSDYETQQSIRFTNDILCPSITTTLLLSLSSIVLLRYSQKIQFLYVAKQPFSTIRRCRPRRCFRRVGSSCISILGSRGFWQKNLQKLDSKNQ